jgi:hypothetical protein
MSYKVPVCGNAIVRWLGEWWWLVIIVWVIFAMPVVSVLVDARNDHAGVQACEKLGGHIVRQTSRGWWARGDSTAHYVNIETVKCIRDGREVSE